MDKIKVTVICLTYNHVRYIRDALDGEIWGPDFCYENWRFLL